MLEFDAFITGANGFIGSHLVQFLLKREKKILVASNRNSISNIKIKKNIAQVKWDILEPAPIMPECKVWIHLAAKTDLQFCYKYPKLAENINTYSLYKILDAAEKSGTDTFIFASTLGVYGNPKYFPTDEKHPKQPIEPYAMSKSKAEEILLSYPTEQIKKRIILRLFNTYGPGQKTKMLIPKLINSAIKDEIVQVYNINTTRDFIYVEDVVRGIYKSHKNGHDGDIINLGTSKETSVMELITLLEKIINRTIKIQVKKSDCKYEIVKRSQSDITKASRILDWHPRIELRNGLEKTFHYANL